MRKPVATSIRKLIERQCKEEKIPFQKSCYRRAKKAYAKIPHTKKHLVG